MTQQIGIDFSCEVLPPTLPGISSVRVSIRADRYKKVGVGSPRLYDSTHPPKKLSEDGQIYSALVGTSLIYKFDELGRVVGLPDKVAFYNRISKVLGGTPKEVAERLPLIEALAGDVAFKYIPDMRATFSAQKVSLGQTWKVLTPQESGDGVSKDWNVLYQGALRLREQQKGVATLEASGKLVPFLAVKGLSPVAMTGTQHGTYHVDVGTGWTCALQLDQNGSVRLNRRGDAHREGDKVGNPNREFLMSNFVTQITMRTLGVKSS